MSIVTYICHQVSSLSYSGPVRIEQATRVLLQLLDQQIQLRNVYTHHPAVLYWAFSSPLIHPSVQKEVVCHKFCSNIFTDFFFTSVNNECYSCSFLHCESSLCKIPGNDIVLGVVWICLGPTFCLQDCAVKRIFAYLHDLLMWRDFDSAICFLVMGFFILLLLSTLVDSYKILYTIQWKLLPSVVISCNYFWVMSSRILDFCKTHTQTVIMAKAVL